MAHMTSRMHRMVAVPVAAAIVLAAAAAFAAPKMPQGFVVTNRDDSGLTWAETGTINLGFSEATTKIRYSMRSQGYKLKHEIFDKSLPGIRLFLWKRGMEEVILLAWTIDFRTSGISWGVSTKEGTALPSTSKKENK